jgi:hypothetical protein
MRLESRTAYSPHRHFAESMELAEDGLYNDSLGSIHLADSTGMDEELETGDAKTWNFPTQED